MRLHETAQTDLSTTVQEKPIICAGVLLIILKGNYLCLCLQSKTLKGVTREDKNRNSVLKCIKFHIG